MPFFNYGAKNGIWSVIHFVKALCKVYVKFAVPIVAFIDASGALTTPEKTAIKEWLAAAQSICVLLQANIEVTYESAP